MSFNLLTASWLPVRRADGSEDIVAVGGLVGGESPPVDLVPPRPDFRAALYEFCVGLLQTVLPPKNAKAWRERLERPPGPDELNAALEPFVPFFELFGEGPRFLQDFQLDKGQPKDRCRVEALLIDAPGESTVKNNGDLFIKRDRVERLCPACAAMALFTMQAFAPSGGAGNRTSLRGGGPLSTLVQGETLWETLWSNVLPLNAKVDPQPEAAPGADGLPGRVFPWAAPTRTSEKGELTHPADVHYLHAYWAMPRRFRLLEESAPGEVCSLCAASADTVVREVVQRPRGYNYGDSWRHPLTPYRSQGTGKSPLSIKGQAGITGYAHWLGVVYGQPDASNKFPMSPAACVVSTRKTARDRARRVMVNGYDMDNMKARRFCSGAFPIIEVAEDAEAEFVEVADMLVRGADQVRYNLYQGLKEALLDEVTRKQAKPDQMRLKDVVSAFWGRTEHAFYDVCAKLAEAPRLDENETLRREWMTTLTRMATTIFDEQVDSYRDNPEQLRRQVEARRKMRNFNYRALLTTLDLTETKEQP